MNPETPISLNSGFGASRSGENNQTWGEGAMRLDRFLQHREGTFKDLRLRDASTWARSSLNPQPEKGPLCPELPKP